MWWVDARFISLSLQSIIIESVSGSCLYSRHLAPNVPLIVPLETWCTFCICATVTAAKLYMLIITVPSLTTRQETQLTNDLLTEKNAQVQINGLVIKCKLKDQSLLKVNWSKVLVQSSWGPRGFTKDKL